MEKKFSFLTMALLSLRLYLQNPTSSPSPASSCRTRASWCLGITTSLTEERSHHELGATFRGPSGGLEEVTPVTVNWSLLPSTENKEGYSLTTMKIKLCLAYCGRIVFLYPCVEGYYGLRTTWHFPPTAHLALQRSTDCTQSDSYLALLSFQVKASGARAVWSHISEDKTAPE